MRLAKLPAPTLRTTHNAFDTFEGFHRRHYKLLVYTAYCNSCLPTLQWSLENKTKSLVFKTGKLVRAAGGNRQSAIGNRQSAIGNRQSADSVENSRPWFAQQKSMRPRLKSLLSAESSGLTFHVAVCKKGVLTSQ
jgi:hypothetical protein